MEIIDYHEIAKSRMTDRFRNDPAFVAIVETLIDLKMIRQQEYINFAETFLDIDKSSGKNLDIIGVLLGQPRDLANFINEPYFGFEGARLAEGYDVGKWYSMYQNKLGTLRTLTDVEYRRVLKARVIKNNSNSSREDLVRVINLLTDNTSAIVDEPSHGVITVSLTDDLGIASYFLSKYKQDNNLIPVPLGFRLSTTYIDNDETVYVSNIITTPSSVSDFTGNSVVVNTVSMPSNAEDKTYSVISSNTDIATIDVISPTSFRVNLHDVGTTTILLEAGDGGGYVKTLNVTSLDLEPPYNLEAEWNESSLSVNLSWEYDE